MNRPQVVSEQEWQATRDALLIKEKECTRALDALAAERRRLPMVRLDPAKYTFTAPDGSAASLADLFDGHRLRLDFNLLDLTPYGRQEQWEDSPEGWPQDPTMSWLRPHDEY